MDIYNVLLRLMKKKLLVIIGARGIGDLIYHLPLLRSLHKSYKEKIIILSNKVNQAGEVYKNEKFVKKIIDFDNNRYGFVKTIKNIVEFKNKINKLNVDKLILTANYRRLAIPVLLSNARKKYIFGLGNLIIDKDKSLNHLTISERLMKYTKDLRLPVEVNNFFLTKPKIKKEVKNKIFINIDSHHDQNNWPINNYLQIIEILMKKNILYINFSPNKKHLLTYFPKKLLFSNKIHYTYKKKIFEIINTIETCSHVIGNESGPICLGSSLKKNVHAIYLPIYTKPESKIIFKKNKYYNADRLPADKIIKKIIKSIT